MLLIEIGRLLSNKVVVIALRCNNPILHFTQVRYNFYVEGKERAYSSEDTLQQPPSNEIVPEA